MLYRLIEQRLEIQLTIFYVNLNYALHHIQKYMNKHRFSQQAHYA